MDLYNKKKGRENENKKIQGEITQRFCKTLN